MDSKGSLKIIKIVNSGHCAGLLGCPCCYAGAPLNYIHCVHNFPVPLPSPPSVTFLAELLRVLAGVLTLCGEANWSTSSKFSLAVGFQIAVSAFGCGDPPGSLYDDQISILFSSMELKSYRIREGSFWCYMFVFYMMGKAVSWVKHLCWPCISCINCLNMAEWDRPRQLTCFSKFVYHNHFALYLNSSFCILKLK
jgi:hypothetical protein